MNLTMTLRRRFSLTWIVAGCLIILIFFLLHTRIQSKPLSLPPLPGTYQYFHEVDFHSTSHRLGAVSHCDARFALNDNLDDHEFRETLLGLMHSYASTMEALGVETWLAHGTLLGWYWNHKFLPWDTDIDVQVSDRAIIELARKHNMSEFEYRLPHAQSVRKYLLDVNPHYRLITSQDVANKIDGRWIDLTNGKFIDITAIHVDKDNSDIVEQNSLFCKDGHRYKRKDIYPLLRSDFEGVEVYVPQNSHDVLRDEYGVKSLTNTRFHWHKFNHKSQLWELE